MGYHFLLQEIFLTQGLNLGFPHCRQTLYHLSHQGSPKSFGGTLKNMLESPPQPVESETPRVDPAKLFVDQLLRRFRDGCNSFLWSLPRGHSPRLEGDTWEGRRPLHLHCRHAHARLPCLHLGSVLSLKCLTYLCIPCLARGGLACP